MSPVVSFGAAADDYARHRAGFPPAFFDRLRAHGVGLPGQSLLDLGTGTGTLARGFAARGARVTGLDPDGDMLARAAALAGSDGVDVRWVRAAAESTGLDTGTFDGISAGQCWHWFRRPEAAREARRLLRPDGALVIAHLDWLPLPGSVPALTESVLRAHGAGRFLTDGTGLYPQWLPDLPPAGFGAIETFSFDVALPYPRAGWAGRIRASAGVLTLPTAAAEALDRAHQAALAEAFPGDALAVPHRVWAVVARAAGGASGP